METTFSGLLRRTVQSWYFEYTTQPTPLTSKYCRTNASSTWFWSEQEAHISMGYKVVPYAIGTSIAFNFAWEITPVAYRYGTEEKFGPITQVKTYTILT